MCDNSGTLRLGTMNKGRKIRKKQVVIGLVILDCDGGN